MRRPETPQNVSRYDGYHAANTETERKALLFCKIGETLYGYTGWRNGMSLMLQVSFRSVERWGAGTVRVPDDVWPALKAECEDRSKALKTLAETLSAL